MSARNFLQSFSIAALGLLVSSHAGAEAGRPRAPVTLRLSPVLSSTNNSAYWTTAFLESNGSPVALGSAKLAVLVDGVAVPQIAPAGAAGWPGYTVVVPRVRSLTTKVEVSYAGSPLHQAASVTETYRFVLPPAVALSVSQPASIAQPNDGAAHPAAVSLHASLVAAGAPIAGSQIRFYACMTADCTQVGSGLSDASGSVNVTTAMIDWRPLSSADAGGKHVRITAMYEGSASHGAAVASSTFDLLPGIVVPADPTAWLAPMNQARAAVGEKPLAWDPIAAAAAQNWARACIFGHDPKATSEYQQAGGTGNVVDMFFGASGQVTTPASAVGGWLAEKATYNHATNTCAPGQSCTHYTQVVWSSTTNVGCAHVICNSAMLQELEVCDFNPGQGDFHTQPPY